MKFDQDLCLNLQYDFGKMNATIGSVVPLAMFFSMPRGVAVLDCKYNGQGGSTRLPTTLEYCVLPNHLK